ncbi:MAG: L-aspartate oxidase, partial [Porphyromonadaceae bacterium]|nr:L-aspartate oxidase [Porphyromonadaceae bacterium]
MEDNHFDCVVVGSGLAGLYTAYLASKHFRRIALVTKQDLDVSNSYHAQGGIAAVTESSDSSDLHFLDTIEAGRGLCEEKSVRVLTREAPKRIRDIVSLGMKFDLDDDGHFSLGIEGGHHHKRILHAGGDSTGRGVTRFMISKVSSSSRITICTMCQALKLLCDEDGCYGVVAWNWSKNREEHFLGKHIIMASGGSAAIYHPTTNPRETVGDGISICYRAGCKIRDMEFVQFHPTSLYTPDGEAFLISEAVRGEGAYLFNDKGERFMLGRHELAELAPRDIVAREIFMQIKSSDQPYVKLSLAHLKDKAALLDRFPTIARHCAAKGYNFTDWIPVAPAAHYTVGGVSTNLYGQTSIANLYAVGELASTGLMGANRLASNSLIECLVFGHRVVQRACSSMGHCLMDSREPYRLSCSDKSTEDLYLQIRKEVASLMISHVGIVRNHIELHEALTSLESLAKSHPLRDDDVYSILTH